MPVMANDMKGTVAKRGFQGNNFFLIKRREREEGEDQKDKEDGEPRKKKREKEKEEKEDEEGEEEKSLMLSARYMFRSAS